MDVTAFTQSTVLVVAGKGGVGKTTVSAALARLAARSGVSVLLVGLEGKGGSSAPFGRQSPNGQEVQLSAARGDDGHNGSAHIRARTLNSDDAMVEYLYRRGVGRMARRLASSGILDVVATAIPGVRDILVLSKIVQLERAGVADLIVVDGPPAGHASTFFTSAQGLLDSSRGGPLRAQAADVVQLLSDPARCQVALVTLAEETPVNETIETAFNLEDRIGIHLGPVIVNDLYPRLDHLSVDPEEAAIAAGVTLRPGHAAAIRAAARVRRRREQMQAQQSARLASGVPLPQLWLPHLFTEEIGLPEIDLLVDALESGQIHLREPPGPASGTGPTSPAPRNRILRQAAGYGS